MTPVNDSRFCDKKIKLREKVVADTNETVLFHEVAY